MPPMITLWKKIEMNNAQLWSATCISAVFGILGWMFLDISDVQNQQGLMKYQVNELKKTQDDHSKILQEQTITLTVIHDKLHDEFGW